MIEMGYVPYMQREIYKLHQKIDYVEAREPFISIKPEAYRAMGKIVTIFLMIMDAIVLVVLLKILYAQA